MPDLERSADSTGAGRGPHKADAADQSDAVALLGANAMLPAIFSEAGLLDTVCQPIVLIDDSDRIVFANTAAATLFGKPANELRGVRAGTLLQGLPTHFCAQVEADIAAGGRGVTMAQFTSATRTSTLESRASIIASPATKIAVCVLRETASCAIDPGAFTISTDTFRKVLHALDEGVMIRDAQGLANYMNPAACRILCLDADAFAAAERSNFAGWVFADATGTELRYDELPFARALRTRKPAQSSLIYYWLPHAKADLWLSASVVPLYRRDGDEQPHAVLSTFTDVTDFKLTRDLLAQTQAIGHIGGYELRFADSRMRWTDEMYRLFDLPPSSALSLQLLVDMLTPQSQELMWEQVASVRRGEPRDGEYEFVTALGNRRWISVKAEPLRQAGLIAGITGTCQEITARRQLENEFRRKAVTDAMTGLANRERVLAELDEQIGLTADDGGPSLIHVDLDRFKIVNDVLGARAGDQLLGDIARRLLTCVPEFALCGRFSGEEFLIVLPAGVSDEKAAEIAETINARLARPFVHATQQVSVTASIGVARLLPSERNAESLLQRATAAMLDARRSGGGTWRFYSPAIDRRVRDARTAAVDLQMALDRRELRLVYQPQLELDSGAVVAAEALLRWDHPTHGELSPLAFVEHAENSGAIITIGAWVIDEACRQLRQWLDAGLAIERIAVNVAHRQMLSEALHEHVSAALQRHGLAGAALELEIVERVLLDGAPETLAMLQHLRDLGVSILLDDFGEGYSSLNYLRRLPVDGFKIGYEFMRRVPINSSDTALCKAMIDVGHAFGLGMIAAGVESEPQREFLRQQRMPLIQGHLLSAPLDATAFAAFAGTRRSARAGHFIKHPRDHLIACGTHAARQHRGSGDPAGDGSDDKLG